MLTHYGYCIDSYKERHIGNYESSFMSIGFDKLLIKRRLPFRLTVANYKSLNRALLNTSVIIVHFHQITFFFLGASEN